VIRTVWCGACKRRHYVQAYIPNFSPVYDEERWPWYVMLPFALVVSVFLWMIAALAIVAWA
jgi:hypothetical protein